MVKLEICGIPVEFPFPPYDSQLIYMEKVLLSLTSKQNAILESPTGTGKELKNTSYRPNVAVLGSREHLCVNEKVSKLRGTRQNLACRSTCKDRRCMYKLGFDSYAKRSKKQAQPIMDIEELVTTMKEKMESIASEAASYALSSNDISGCISEVDTFIRGLSNNSIQLNAGSNLTMEVRKLCE
ncbi:hypothetical protein AM588_10003718 [Phytophthora nicotianae]|uniref:Helicase-like DEXD box c2 type domain-containing protein n=1 Tax=Phytophthora nicotianae TaxID=4792 RepID=A0A0W8D8C6_PHYNI|nr:hypothetical protein AM588_10003718 [Phytophthora nicotianae]